MVKSKSMPMQCRLNFEGDFNRISNRIAHHAIKSRLYRHWRESNDRNIFLQFLNYILYVSATFDKSFPSFFRFVTSFKI